MLLTPCKKVSVINYYINYLVCVNCEYSYDKLTGEGWEVSSAQYLLGNVNYIISWGLSISTWRTFYKPVINRASQPLPFGKNESKLELKILYLGFHSTLLIKEASGVHVQCADFWLHSQSL